MFAVKIYKDGQQTNEGRFQTEQEALSWLEMGETNGWWKIRESQEIVPAVTELREVEIQPEERDEDGNIIQERVVEMQEVVVQPEQTIIHPATHTYEIVDVQDEIGRKQALNRRSVLRGRGERIIDEISLKNTEMGLTIEQLKTIMLDQDFVLVRELLWAGSLETAKAIIIEKQEKFIEALGEDYYNWVLNKIDEGLAN